MGRIREKTQNYLDRMDRIYRIKTPTRLMLTVFPESSLSFTCVRFLAQAQKADRMNKIYRIEHRLCHCLPRLCSVLFILYILSELHSTKKRCEPLRVRTMVLSPGRGRQFAIPLLIEG
jgi:hypothetical protein